MYVIQINSGEQLRKSMRGYDENSGSESAMIKAFRSNISRNEAQEMLAI